MQQRGRASFVVEEAVEKLVGEGDAWRIRIGDCRVLYEVLDDVLVVTVVRVAHREVYK
ncbi:mRNA-degrading endonuclease RelE of RelBE toxin-antitoxin system [Conyzicola nivalis]|uniref:mRNA-degrading endonuclease RelE of RelBE toxin-antitoxin system n=1 Tax=Conyzicola nivalis TaxID=1477021 RepID=A0ABV2QPH9_9MICO